MCTFTDLSALGEHQNWHRWRYFHMADLVITFPFQLASRNMEIFQSYFWWRAFVSSRPHPPMIYPWIVSLQGLPQNCHKTFFTNLNQFPLMKFLNHSSALLFAFSFPKFSAGFYLMIGKTIFLHSFFRIGSFWRNSYAISLSFGMLLASHNATFPSWDHY